MEEESQEQSQELEEQSNLKIERECKFPLYDKMTDIKVIFEIPSLKFKDKKTLIDEIGVDAYEAYRKFFGESAEDFTDRMFGNLAQQLVNYLGLIFLLQSDGAVAMYLLNTAIDKCVLEIKTYSEARSDAMDNA